MSKIGKMIGSELDGDAVVPEEDAHSRVYKSVAEFVKSAYKTALMAGVSAASIMVPWDINHYIGSDWANLTQLTSTPSQDDSEIYNTANGQVKFSNGDQVPDGFTIFFFDKTDRQIVGQYSIDPFAWGAYDLRNGGYKMVGFNDSLTTPADSGWVSGDPVGAFLRDPNGKFFNATFNDNPTFNGAVPYGYIGRHDITVGNEIAQVPEPALPLLFLVGLGTVGLAGALGASKNRLKEQLKLGQQVDPDQLK